MGEIKNASTKLASGPGRDVSSALTGWIFALYLGLLVWAPLPLASNRPWAWAVLEIWILLLSLCWLIGFIRGRVQWSPLLSAAKPALLCAGLWTAYVWFQLVPLPIGLLEILSAESARWHIAAAAMDRPFAAPLTLDRYATLEGACLSTAYVAFFALSLALLDRRERIRMAAYALVASGVVQALYGAAIDGSAGDPIHGTFANRNHFASYLLLCLSAGLGALIGSLSGARSIGWKQWVRNVVDWMLTGKMVLRLSLLVMVIALVLTRSRMANTAFFVSLLAVGTIGLALSRRASRPMIILLISLVALDVFVVGTYFGARQVVERIATTTPQSEDRDELIGYSLDMWKDYPAFGAGLGSFRTVFPRYSGSNLPSAYSHAHNDFVEFAAETGLIGLALLGVLVTMSFVAALRAQYVRTDPLMRGMSFGAMMGIIALMIHSSVDFNLQIPANALTFMVTLAFAWVALHQRQAPH